MNPALQSVLEYPAIWRGGDLPAAAGPALASGFSALDAQLPGGGWPVGALTEILSDAYGIGELSMLLPLLSRLTREGRSVVWVVPPYLPYAPALAAAGMELEHNLVVIPEALQEAFWVMEQVLRSGACGAVLGWLDDLGTRPDYCALRRLQLAAEAGGVAGFLYRPPIVARIPSPAPLRLNLAVEGIHLIVRILKRRGAAGCAPLRLAVQGLRPRNEMGPLPGRSSGRASSERLFDVPNLTLSFGTLPSPQGKTLGAH